METEEKIETYLVKYIHHDLSPDELSELKQLLKDNEAYRQMFVKCLSAYKNHRKIEFLRSHDRTTAWQMLCRRRQKLKRLRIRRIISYAAVIVLLLGGGVSSYIWYNHQFSVNLGGNMADENQPKVILTLAGGQQVVLGEEQKIIDEAGKVVIRDSSTHLSYQRMAENKTEIEYNELTVPRGIAYSLTLADGTRVWLNSDSHLRFPVFFPKENREVELVGEAYFEVAKDAKRPFSVKVGVNRIEVLGTHFNISAYSNENGIYTTLAEGSVRIKTPGEEKLLVPGEQAGMSWEGANLEVREVDVSFYTSWRLGLYEFRNTSLEEIVRCLSRWYDIEVQFASEDIKSKRFTGAFQRSDSLNFTLENLEKISGLQFAREGKRWMLK